MKAAFLYFSGTGNTKRVMDYAKASLPFDCDIYDALGDRIVDMDQYDYLVIFYPIYGFNAPKPILDYAKKIQRCKEKKPCLVMKNSGEHLFWNNASSLYLHSVLKRRNIDILSEYHYLMPYSFLFRHSDYMAYKLKMAMEGLVPLDLADFLEGRYRPIRRFFFDRPFAFLLRIQWWGGRFNGRFYRIDAEKCIHCLRCVKNCPSHNIAYEEGRFRFGKRCLMCQRCAMYCPKDAFSSLGFFSSWKVNGPYSFEKAETFQKEVKPNYCKKNYAKYFAEAEKRIQERTAE